MPEEHVQVAHFILMFVVLLIVVAILEISSPFSAVYGNLSQSKETITIIGAAAEVAWDGYITYDIGANVNFHVDPDPEEDSGTVKYGIVPLISFKDSYARASLPSYPDNVIRLAAGEDEYNFPDLKFEVKSNSQPVEVLPFPPLKSVNEWVYTNVEMKSGHTYLLEDDIEKNRYLVSLSYLDVEGIIGLGRECVARLRIECSNDLKDSGKVEECDGGNKEDCVDTTILNNCGGGTVTVKAVDLFCGQGYGIFTITTRGGTEWEDVGETAVLSLFRNSKCVQAALSNSPDDVKALNENCPDDFLASRKMILKI